MSILWAATSIADIPVLAGAIAFTSAGSISDNVSEGFVCGSTVGATLSSVFEPMTELWLTEYHRPRSSFVDVPANKILTFNSPDNEALFGLNVTNYDTTPPKFQKKTALNTWSDVATGAFIIPSALTRLDVYLKIHATEGVFRLYVSGTLCIDFAGDTTAYRTNVVNRIGFGSTNSSTSGGSVHSAIALSDQDTRPVIFYQRMATGNGAETSWTGDYTAIDETGINDADFVSSVVVDDVETFTFPALPSDFNTNRLTALVLSGRTSGSGSPGNVRGVARVGSTNYDVPGETDTSPAFGCQQWIFETNPATGQPWLGSEVNASQFGVKAT